MKEVKAVVNSRPLVHVGADFSSGFTLTPGDFLKLNPKTGVPSLAVEDQQQHPDFLSELSSSQKHLDMWLKGPKHLDMFWNLWFDEYVPSLCERTQKHLKAPRPQSSTQPTKVDVVLLKKSSLQGTWKLAVVEELISSTDGANRAATVRTASGKLLNRTLNFVYPLECAEQRETQVQPSRSEDGQYDASHQRTRQKLTIDRPIWKAAIKARHACPKQTVEHLILIANCYFVSSISFFSVISPFRSVEISFRPRTRK